ncbi:hypothetical protein GX408_10665 [bacterium]|nr:hypothetical protein [bacterium]
MGIAILSKDRPVFSLNAVCLTLSAILLFLTSAQAEQSCKIISVKDTNLFLTRDSVLISLANVQTLSIHSPDSLQRKIAQRYFKTIEQKLLNKSFIMEMACRDDSSVRVHLFKKLSIGRQSINMLFLREGWAALNPNPANEYLKGYELEAQESARNGRGVYGDPATAKPGAKGALWLSAGLGASTNNPRWVFRTTDLTVSCRLNRLVFSAGQEYHCSDAEPIYQQVLYGLGMATVQRSSETALLFGLTVTDDVWEWAIDRGFFIKLNRFYHLKQGLGLGVAMIVHRGESAEYATLSVQIILGGWKN